jgi:hypothetical protein
MLGLPWRYALACIDELGLILRRDMVCQNRNPLPETVTDRVRGTHEYACRFTRQPCYYADLNAIREPCADVTATTAVTAGLGRLPGSVWRYAARPLRAPARLGVDHYAAFPPRLADRIVLGGFLPAVCTGRTYARRRPAQQGQADPAGRRGWNGHSFSGHHLIQVAGPVCACTPTVPLRPAGGGWRTTDLATGRRAQPTGRAHTEQARPPRLGYDLDGWQPAPTRPAGVLDCFGGSGTVAMVARARGRLGVSPDLSFHYARPARWRAFDPGRVQRLRGTGASHRSRHAAGQLELLGDTSEGWP